VIVSLQYCGVWIVTNYMRPVTIHCVRTLLTWMVRKAGENRITRRAMPCSAALNTKLQTLTCCF